MVQHRWNLYRLDASGTTLMLPHVPSDLSSTMDLAELAEWPPTRPKRRWSKVLRTQQLRRL